ncbi:MAG: hypothetical protein Solumvirus2_71, partial [Solumvirus sp.]
MIPRSSKAVTRYLEVNGSLYFLNYREMGMLYHGVALIHTGMGHC